MVSTRSHLCVLALLWALPTAAHAQASADSLQVPVGALRVLGIPVDANRPLAMLRAIRLLHSLPNRGELSEPISDFYRLLDDLDRLEREFSRTGARGIALAMTAANSGDRDALRDTLEALGLRLREQRQVFAVETETGKTATERRQQLVKGGIDPSTIQTRLNAGETVHVAPPVVELPLPLPFESWTPDVLAGRMTPTLLFNALIRSRDASLLFYGVQTMSADTRAYLVKTPGMVQWLHEHAPMVAAFGSAFRVGPDGRALMPGGAEAQDLWESLADEKLDRPDRFARALFGRDGGRLAYFADTLWTLDEAHTRFALGLWMGDRRLRHERFAALYQAFAQIEPAWSITDAPFNRPSYDVALLLSNLRLTDTGLLAGPAYRKLWERAASGIELPDAEDRQMRELADDGVADAAFLAGLIVAKYTRDRRVIVERIDAGQRIFGDAADAEMQDVFIALRAYGRFPAVTLALERLGIRKPAVYVQAARSVAALEGGDPGSLVPLLAQFQGAMALLARAARTAAMPPPALERLATSLIAVPLDNEHYRGGIAGWVRTQLVPALEQRAASSTLEERLLDVLVDRFVTDGGPFSWEGQHFVVDAEPPRRELRTVRERQKGNTLDALLAVYAHVDALAGPALTLDALKSRAAMLRGDVAKLSPARPWPDAPEAAPVVAKVVERVIKELTAIRKPADVSKAPRIVRPLVDALDYLLGETLVALAYASALGDTGRGPAAAVDISHRHVFGLTSGVPDARRLAPWQRPERGSAVAAGDAVTGSVMGIDVALSRTRLRRLTADALAESPRLNANDSETMTRTVALLNPRHLDDAQAREIAQALQRGRGRVEQAAPDAQALDRLAADARMDPPRRGLLEWTSRHRPASVNQMFSLAELFRLGGGKPSAVDPWGTSHDAVTGCLCIRFPDDTAWELTIGRRDTGQLGARVAELNLRIAAMLADLGVPATLFPAVMALATQDYINTVPVMYPDDWAALAGGASALTRERVEDYVSAVVASGPVRVVEETGPR
jgi:hypothetical protein